ncbi:MAG TPA: PRC-barrel domain-containing protein, partial [Dehalococcoidia bacterium]|nr:PRC-barrel domain-containing protein [Dehalococcoidia bacterium]
MNLSVKELFEYKIRAEDGDIGSLFDVLFDVMDWTARYFVVDTGGWLFGRKVLIAPVATTMPDAAGKLLPVRLTKQQVKDSPDIASDPPLSLEQEIAYNDYYRWPYYWLGSGNVGLGHIDALAEVPLRAPLDADPNPSPSPLPPQDRDFRLRSARHVRGNRVKHDDD